MEGINTSRTIDPHSSGVHTKAIPVYVSKGETSSSSPSGSTSIASELQNLASLSSKAQQSSPELRPELISRAKSLIADPNWLSDQNLDSLASKIAKVENL
jgi:hypothetical protein